MTASIPVNGGRLRERLLELHISERAFARNTGLGDAAVRGMLLDNGLNGSVSVADFHRVMVESGLPASELLDPSHEEEPDDSPSADVPMLSQVLHADMRVHPEDRVALALGWTMDRLREAEAALDQRLRPIGMFVHRTTMGVTIRACDARAGDASRHLTAYRDAEEGIDQGTARVLYSAYAGTLSATDTTTDRMMKLRALYKRGAISFGRGKKRRVRLTADVAYAFDVDD